VNRSDDAHIPFKDRYRLYLDESGDHVFRRMEHSAHRFLCLLGCWFKNDAYVVFHNELEALKQQFFPHNPDDPLILHREDIINRRGPFKTLQDPTIGAAFDQALLDLICAADFRLVSLVIDKGRLQERYGEMTTHPYHLAVGFMLQRYARFLNRINRKGDVLTESRGGREDRLLKDEYTRVFERGIWKDRPAFFQAALTTKQLKIKPKRAGTAGLQLSDILGHPLKQFVLEQNGRLEGTLAPFAQQIAAVVKDKWYCNPNSGRVDGYGMVLFPK